MKTKAFITLVAIFVALKISGIISLSWWWVLTPVALASIYVLAFAATFAFSEDDRG